MGALASTCLVTPTGRKRMTPLTAIGCRLLLPVKAVAGVKFKKGRGNFYKSAEAYKAGMAKLRERKTDARAAAKVQARNRPLNARQRIQKEQSADKAALAQKRKASAIVPRLLINY